MQTFQEVEDKLSPFVKAMVQSEKRFRFHIIGNETFNDEKFFVVTKEIIHLPCVLPAAEHEIAHAVEMKNQKRWLLPDWGIPFKKFSIDKGLTARMMFTAMAREVRVRAIQLHMMPESEQTNPNSSLTNILRNEHAWGHWAKTMVPFGKFKTYQDVDVWVNDLRERTFKAWSQDRIAHEWKIRLTHMQNWMETV